MELKPARRRRALCWIAFLIAAVIVGLYLILPIGVGVSVILPYQETVGAPPAGFEPVTLTTDDQVELAGWYKPPLNGAAIILIHGAGGGNQRAVAFNELFAAATPDRSRLWIAPEAAHTGAFGLYPEASGRFSSREIIYIAGSLTRMLS
jgi:hypothetical protein